MAGYDPNQPRDEEGKWSAAVRAARKAAGLYPHSIAIIMESDAFSKKFKSNFSILFERNQAINFPEDSEIYTDIKSGIPTSKIRSSEGFGACSKVSLDACNEDPLLKIAIGVAFSMEDIARIENFDPDIYWGMSGIGLPHVWNVTEAGQVIDHALGSSQAAKIYIGTIIDPGKFTDPHGDDILNYMYSIAGSSTDIPSSLELDKMYEAWRRRK